MIVKIIETDVLTDLTIIDKNGIEWTNDLLGNNNATTYNEETEEHEMSQEAYNWWDEYITNLKNDEREVIALAEELNIDEDIINDKIMAAMQHENDLNDEHNIKQSVFQDIRSEYEI